MNPSTVVDFVLQLLLYCVLDLLDFAVMGNLAYDLRKLLRSLSFDILEKIIEDQQESQFFKV